MDAYEQIMRDMQFFKRTLAEVINLVERLERAEADMPNMELWGYGTLRVKEELSKLARGGDSDYWG